MIMIINSTARGSSTNRKTPTTVTSISVVELFSMTRAQSMYREVTTVVVLGCCEENSAPLLVWADRIVWMRAELSMTNEMQGMMCMKTTRNQ